MSEVKNRIKEIREALDLTQSDLAKKTGLSCAAISQFEGGERTPSLKTLEKIVKALDVSMGDLIGEKSKTDKLDTKAQLLFRDYSCLSPEDKKVIEDIVRSFKAKHSKNNG